MCNMIYIKELNLSVPETIYPNIKEELDQVIVLAHLLDKEIIINSNQIFSVHTRIDIVIPAIALIEIKTIKDQITRVELNTYNMSNESSNLYNLIYLYHRNREDTDPYEVLLKSIQYVKNIL